MRVLWLSFAIAWTFLLFKGVGSLPALGPLIDVHAGVWRHHEVELRDATIKGLRAKVTITFDRSGIPHIFSESSYDAYLTQGYLEASQRLFQMDLITRAMAGELSDLVGSSALKYDQFFTKLNMRQSTKDALEVYQRQLQTQEMLEAYSDGVNQYIDGLEELPVEYKIFGKLPRHFGPLDWIRMGKSLTYNLAGRTFDLSLTELSRTIGVHGVLDLFPEFLPEQFEDFIDPRRAHHVRELEKESDFAFSTHIKRIPLDFPWANPGQGSNNWSVAPIRSSSGTSLFANDTHLSITLPSVWYESQISYPGQNAYGVGLIGLPGIINGLNSKTVWGPTNGTTDVLDFYEVEFKDNSSLEYRYKSGWKTATSHQEEIKVNGGRSEFVDVILTHLGPVLYREGKYGLVVDWAGHRFGDEMIALQKASLSQTAADCIRAFSTWHAPIQNFMCVDKHNISWSHAGFIPQRNIGMGRFIMDGTNIDHGLTTPLPGERRPHSANPSQGFLLSANQKALSPGMGEYLGWDYEPPFRGMRIREVLMQNKKMTALEMIDLQKDALNEEAKVLLPRLLKLVEGAKLDSNTKEAIEKLKKWDFIARAEMIEPSIYKNWANKFRDAIFSDDWMDLKDQVPYPGFARVAWLIDRLVKNPNDSDAKWIDDKATEKIETIQDLAVISLTFALKALRKDLGSDQAHWTWKYENKVSFQHVARLPGFGTDILAIDGAAQSVRGQASHHGAVYKLVVETGDWPKAWIQVPGGNEGDPFHRNYGHSIDEWTRGEMREVEFYHDLDQAKSRASRILQFFPGAS